MSKIIKSEHYAQKTKVRTFQQTPAADKVTPETHTLTNVEIFATGKHNGDIYTESDLDGMVVASKEMNFTPPLKAGHTETPGLPAIGWIENVRRIGQKLVADITHIPAEIYNAIKRRGYDRVSSEIYVNLEKNGRRFKYVLKAVSILGADIPSVTSLKPLHELFSGMSGEVHVHNFRFPMKGGFNMSNKHEHHSYGSLEGCKCQFCENARKAEKFDFAQQAVGAEVDRLTRERMREKPTLGYALALIDALNDPSNRAIKLAYTLGDTGLHNYSPPAAGVHQSDGMSMQEAGEVLDRRAREIMGTEPSLSYKEAFSRARGEMPEAAAAYHGS